MYQLGNNVIEGPVGLRNMVYFDNNFKSPIFEYVWEPATATGPVMEYSDCFYKVCPGGNLHNGNNLHTCGFHAHWLLEQQVRYFVLSLNDSSLWRSAGSQPGWTMVLFEGREEITIHEKGFKARRGRVIGIVDDLYSAILHHAPAFFDQDCLSRALLSAVRNFRPPKAKWVGRLPMLKKLNPFAHYPVTFLAERYFQVPLVPADTVDKLLAEYNAAYWKAPLDIPA